MSSSDFVRYSPEIETIDPDLDELMEQIIDFWEKTEQAVLADLPSPRPSVTSGAHLPAVG